MYNFQSSLIDESYMSLATHQLIELMVNMFVWCNTQLT